MKANGAARLLSKVFNIMLADRSPLQESKRLGIIHVTNLAFKIYTKVCRKPKIRVRMKELSSNIMLMLYFWVSCHKIKKKISWISRIFVVRLSIILRLAVSNWWISLYHNK
ncbi:hypothetical protein BDA99DRAFT_280680 [Phascolomyces articulosus]|uniref:Uncharacterized protein n=1 Tax=Phascolomyces articulosus TaxID=60185 RepID=A0AAD5K7Q1_9FUNG|nr:hypothetical protein BDA99DRAFT_280680 [Phascolomyces articulosus]